MKIKIKKIRFLVGACFGAQFWVSFAFAQTTAQAPTQMKYTMLESLPGFFQAGATMIDLPDLILALYKFGIWTVGIAGMFMIVIGGISYMMSAGNKSSAGSAKGIINDAILGVVTALCAYLALYVINPDFTRISLNFVPVAVVDKITESSSATCTAITDSSNPCSVSQLKFIYTSLFGGRLAAADAWSTEASSICNKESGGIPSAGSIAGKCDRYPIAVGLFQINLTVHKIKDPSTGKILDCPSAFGGIGQAGWTRSNASSCKIIDIDLYKKCTAAAADINTNYKTMWQLYTSSGGSWSQWEVTNSKYVKGACSFPKGTGI